MAALVSGLVLGAVVERVVVRPVEGGPPLNAVIVTLGAARAAEAVAGMIWGGNPKSFPPAFSIQGYKIAGHAVPVLAVRPVHRDRRRPSLLVALVLLFRRTTLGLRMRASAFAPEVAAAARRARGADVHRRLGAGLAGRLAGRRARGAGGASSPRTNFDAVLVFGFTAAVIGGLESPPRRRWSAASCSGWRCSYVSATSARRR